MQRALVLTVGVVTAMLAACGGSDSTAPATTAPATTTTRDPVTTVARPTTTRPPAETTVPSSPRTTAARRPVIAAGGTPTKVPCPTGAFSNISCWTVAVPLDPADPASEPIDLAVTLVREKPDVWTSPVLMVFGAAPAYPWARNDYVLDGHDQVYVDLRGYGRSEGAVTCPDLADYPGQIQTGIYTDAAVDATKRCLAAGAASTVPVATSMDHGTVAADLVAVRKALGIDRWSLVSTASGANIALNLVDLDGDATTAWFASSPETVGHGWSPNSTAQAFARFAADCAEVPSCSAAGDVNALLDQALAKVAGGVVTNVKEPKTGVAVTIDGPALLNGVRFALGDKGLAPALPGLLKGVADGTQLDTVASYYVGQAPPMTPIDVTNPCQASDYVLPGRVNRAEDKAGPFTGMSFGMCEKFGDVPQYTPAPAVSSSIPVMVVTASYNSRGSEANTEAVTAGFSDVTSVFVPGIANALLELGPCYLGVASAFLAAPGPVDTACLTEPAVKTLT